MNTKKIISALLALIMLFGLVPLSAYAQDNDPNFANWGDGDTMEGALEDIKIKVGYRGDFLDWLYIQGFGVVKQRYTYFQLNDTTMGEIIEKPA